MGTDVIPELNKAIQISFQNNAMKDRQIAQVAKKISDGTATFLDAQNYAIRLGVNLSKSLQTTFSETSLPNGKLNYDIAKRTVIPALKENYELVNGTAADIQTIEDNKLNIGLQAVTADFPEERIQGLIVKMTSDDITLEKAIQIWMSEPIINNTIAFFDDFIRVNAEQRSKAGLKTTITRTAESGCCKWCDALAGIYDYKDHPDDIFKRHEFCRCSLTYQSGKKSQNAWTKAEWKSSRKEINRRKHVGEKTKMTPTERIQAANSVYKDKVVHQMAADIKEKEGKLWSSSRAKALRKYKKLSPEERISLLNTYESKHGKVNP